MVTVCVNMTSYQWLVLFLIDRISSMPLPRRRHWFRHGHAAHLQDPGGVPGPHDANLLRVPVPQGLRHRGRALQRDAVGAPARGER
jgi:hypothetical protein